MSANDDMLDLQLRRAVAIQRFTNAEVRRLLELLATQDVAFAEFLSRQLSRVPSSIRTKRFTELSRRIVERRDEIMRQIRIQMNSSLKTFIKDEAVHQVEALTAAVPVQLEFNSVNVAQLNNALFNDPFADGQILSSVNRTVLIADRRRLLNAIRLGVLQSLSTEDIVRSIVGSRATGFTDGLFAITRRNTQTIVRTALNHASNSARNLVWLANSAIIEGVMWVSTLDGRTSVICRARDGAVGSLKPGGTIPRGVRKLVPPTARPPAHFQCRSTTTAIISTNGIVNLMGERPFVRDTRTRRFRERNFRREARDAAGSRWTGWSTEQRTAAVRRARVNWANQNIGRVPASTTYPEWLRRQPRPFINDVLGQRKAGLFLSGDVSLDQMVNQFGDELTLADLRRRVPSAFD